MYLYWVTTEDHDEDWFVVANNAKEAASFHEDVEGYDIGDASAEMILEIQEGVSVDVGWPSEEILEACGAKIIQGGDTRVVEIDGRKFAEGLMESMIRTVSDDVAEALGEGRPSKTERLKEH